MTNSKVKIVIAGGSGFLGVNLAQALLESDYEVCIISRNPPKTNGNWKYACWDAHSLGEWINELNGADAIINLAGRSVDCIILLIDGSINGIWIGGYKLFISLQRRVSNMSNFKNLAVKSTNRYLSLLGLVVLGVMLLLIINWPLSSSKAAPPQVGIGTAQQNAFEFVGRIDQNNLDFNGFGYLTYIRGFSNAEIYTDTLNLSEDTARFTYVATATLTSRAILTDVFVINAEGSMTFYFTETPPDRSFDNAAGFASGIPIATTSIRYQDILLVQSPNRGLASGISEATQLSASTFSLNGQDYQFGQPNQFYRLTSIGNGTRTNINPPVSFVLLAGNGITTGQQVYLPTMYRSGN